MHSREGCYTYVKEIVKGESYVMLSQEEVEALRKAVNFGLGEVNEKKKEKTTKVVRNSTYMYRELANLCEKRKKYSRNMP